MGPRAYARATFASKKNLPQLRVFPFIFLAVVVYRCVNLYSLEIFLGHTVFSFSCSPLTGGVAEKKLSKNRVPRYIFLSIHPKLSQQSTVYVYVYMYTYCHALVTKPWVKNTDLKLSIVVHPLLTRFGLTKNFLKMFIYVSIYYIIL